MLLLLLLGNRNTQLADDLGTTSLGVELHDRPLGVESWCGVMTERDVLFSLPLLLLCLCSRHQASTLQALQQTAARRAVPSRQAPSTFRALHLSEDAQPSPADSSSDDEAGGAAVGGMAFMLPAGQIFL